MCACSASFFLSPCSSGSAGRNHFMIGLIRSAGFNRRPQLNKHRCARPQPQMPRRRRLLRRASRLFPVMRPRGLLPPRAVTGCGTRLITILSIARPTRLTTPNNNPAKTTGSIAVVCAIITMPLRRLQRRRSGERGSAFQAGALAKAADQKREVTLYPLISLLKFYSPRS